MSRIDAQLVSQIGDQQRPAQTSRDQFLQVAAARSRVAADISDNNLVDEDPPSHADVRAAAAEIKQVLEMASGRSLSFNVDDSGKQILVRVMSPEGELLRQIPSKEMLELHKKLAIMVGILVDAKA